ncbi:MAG: hypothetical protein AAF719_13345 [Pseudomonadota bacterium]
MALFFDQEWFDARLSAVGLTREALALAAGMTPDEMDLIYKDQREVEDEEVAAFANLLAADHREVADRCGVATPDWGEPITASNGGHRLSGGLSPVAATPVLSLNREALTGLHERIDRIEQLLERVLTKLERLENGD